MIGILCYDPLVTTNTNIETSLIEVVYICFLLLILIGNSLELLEPCMYVIRLMSILIINVNTSLLANEVLRMPVEKSSSPLLTHCWFRRGAGMSIF
jgi:hypothetical protein